MDLTNAEAITPAGPISTAIQPFDDFLDPKRARAAIAEKIQLENEPYRFGFNRIDCEFLFDLCASLFGFDQLVTKWRRCPVPEPLAGVFLHRSDDVFGIFLGLIFIE